MERKEKPKVPVKPHTLSVSEKAKIFERIASEIVVSRPVRIQKSESDIEEVDLGSKVIDATLENVHISPVDTDYILDTNEEIKR